MYTGTAPALRPAPAHPGEPRRRLRHLIRESLIAGCDRIVAALAAFHPRLALRYAEALRGSLLRRWLDLAPWRVEGPGISFELLDRRSWVRSIEAPAQWPQMTGVDRTGRYEAAFFDAFVQHAGRARVVVDAGAARGLYSMLALHLEGPREVHAFEPDPLRRFALRLNLLRTLLRAPASKRAFIRRALLGNQAPGCLTLDRYCRRAGVRPDLVKMDIEGAEIEVLEGARAVCMQCRPTLLIEFHERRLRRQGRDPGRLLALLEEYGYRVRFNGHHGALETGDRTAAREWLDEPPNRDLTAILAVPR